MALGFRVQLDDRAKLIAQALRDAPARLRAQWQRSLVAELEKGVAHIQRTYRSGGPGNITTPEATKVITGNLRASYSEDVRRAGDEIIGDFGVLRKGARGKALVYAAVHEFGATISKRKGKALRRPIRIPPRPSPEGAINRTAHQITPLVLQRLAQDAVEVLHG